MRAHFVPVGYLKGFSPDPSAERSATVTVVERQKMYQTSVESICACSDYYSHFPEEDGALFAAQETLLPQLTSIAPEALPADLAPHLWRLKVRNRAILDNTRYRDLILPASQTVDLGTRKQSIIVAHSPCELITSDDPLILYGYGEPSDLGFLLPVSPDRLVVSVPVNRFAIVSGTASAADVELINRLTCRQARRCVIMRSPTGDPSTLRLHMRASPQPAASGVAHGRTPAAFLNFTSVNPQGPDGTPSFLQAL